MGIKIITPPASEPITLAEAKQFLRVDYDTGVVLPCATTNESATITPTSTRQIYAGMGVSGAGIQSGAIVSSVGATTITLSKTATATAAAAVLTFTADGLSNEEDALISGLITSAREYCEAYQNRALLLQTIEASFDEWPCFPVRIPRPPLASVSSIKYYGTDNAEYTLDPANYYVDADSDPGRIALAYGVSLPNTTLRAINSVKIRYTAGGASAANVPVRVRQAMFLLIGYWYENREAAAAGKIAVEVAFSVHALLSIGRVWPV